MNAVAFYVFAALAVVTAGGAVLLPVVRLRLVALVAMLLALAVLMAFAGAIAVAVVQAAFAAALAVAALLALRAPAGRTVLAGEREAWSASRVAAAGAGALGLLVLLVVVFLASAGDWHHGSGIGALITTLHYRTPYALLVAAVLLAAGACAGLVLGRTSGDERHLDRALEARRLREERERRRREAREQARRGRGTAPPAEARR